MSAQLTREQFAKAGNFFELLLVNGQPAAIVASVRDEALDLFNSFYGHNWQLWIVVGGVEGGPWLMRSALSPTEAPLLLELSDRPVLLKASWDAPASTSPRVKVRVGRKRKLNA